MPNDIEQSLEELGIEEFERDIFSMSKAKLYENFSYPSTGTFYYTRCIRNLIWQDYQRLQSGDLELALGNIRSYWYARTKPVLSRAKVKDLSKKYDTMINQFVAMVVDHRLFNYGDFGFADHNQNNRAIGTEHRHIFCVSEKEGHYPLLEQLHRDYDITVTALGGQPSALSSEYLLHELNESGFSSAEPVPLFTIVDYDPAGDSIARSFIWQMTTLGFPGEFTRIDLVHPSRMTADQIELNKYNLSRAKREKKKNQQWAGRTGGLQDYGYGLFQGLQADAMTWPQLLDAFHEIASGHLGIPRDAVIQRRLKRDLISVSKELLLQRILGW